MRAGQALWAYQPTDPGAEPDYRELYERTYSYRADGHTASVTDTVTGTRTLTLDAPGRILSSTWSEGTETYAYDGLGGLSTAVTPTQPAAQTGPALAWDGLQGRGSRTHYDLDERGRVTRILRTTISGKRLQWHLTWNQRGRLTDANCPDGSRWSYRYDPLGRRTAKEHWHADGSAGTQIEFSWFNTTLLEQRVVGAAKSDVTTSWDYHPQTGEPIAQTALVGGGQPGEGADARWQAIIGDPNGIPVTLVDAEGELTWQPAASVWGAPLREDAGPGPCPLRFAGQYHDPETGLHYNYARYYDPATGHYLSPDPLGLGPDPNPRSYVGNPWDQTDPLGLAKHTYREPGGNLFAIDPNKPPPPTYTRSSEYPHSYSAATHEEMVKRWTDEGRKAGGWPTKGGVRMAMEDMTWRDADENKLEIGTADRDRLTYDHIPPVVQHWNSTGYDTDRAARNAWHDNPDHLRPMLKGPNSSAGARLPDSFRQDVGDNYKCGK
jgi:RHS repeat-associated protein